MDVAQSRRIRGRQQDQEESLTKSSALSGKAGKSRSTPSRPRQKVYGKEAALPLGKRWEHRRNLLTTGQAAQGSWICVQVAARTSCDLRARAGHQAHIDILLAVPDSSDEQAYVPAALGDEYAARVRSYPA